MVHLVLEELLGEDCFLGCRSLEVGRAEEVAVVGGGGDKALVLADEDVAVGVVDEGVKVEVASGLGRIRCWLGARCGGW